MQNGERLSCLAHTLQLVIKNGLSDVSSVTRAIETVARAISSVNKSYVAKEKLESLNKLLVKRNSTRWSSEFNMIRSFLSLSESDCEAIFDRKNVITLTQRVILGELVQVLENFDVTTTLIQTDKFSIDHILPLIKGLKIELNKLKTLKHCEKIRLNLLTSLDKKFWFLETSEIYNLAAILTPKYGKRWLDNQEQEKWDEILYVKVSEFLARFPNIFQPSSEHTLSPNETDNRPSSKRLKLLSNIPSQPHCQ